MIREEYLRKKKEYYLAHHAHYLDKALKRRKLERLKALQIISGQEKPVCRRCGCSLFPVLEINHVNRDGSMEPYRGSALCTQIVHGHRDVSDLEVVCIVCNVIHWVEREYNLRYEVKLKGMAFI